MFDENVINYDEFTAPKEYNFPLGDYTALIIDERVDMIKDDKGLVLTFEVVTGENKGAIIEQGYKVFSTDGKTKEIAGSYLKALVTVLKNTGQVGSFKGKDVRVVSAVKKEKDGGISPYPLVKFYNVSA
jgi:hypothetical protein